jgi:uncharacterized protein (DUF952 family)
VLILAINPHLLISELVAEPSTNQEIYPHIYGKINKSAIVEIYPKVNGLRKKSKIETLVKM